MRPGPYTFLVAPSCKAAYMGILGELGRQQGRRAAGSGSVWTHYQAASELEKTLKDIKADFDQGKVPHGATHIGNEDGGSVYAIALFGYRFHFHVDEPGRILAIARIDTEDRPA